MSNSDNIPPVRSCSKRYQGKTNPLDVGYLVALTGRRGLHKVLEVRDDGRCAFRALNLEAKPLIYAYGDEVVDFSLPIYHCFVAQDRWEIVALVSGLDFDVTYNDPSVAAPLFQKVHAAEMVCFCEMALAAGFTRIDLGNGYDVWEGLIEEMIVECRNYKVGAYR